MTEALISQEKFEELTKELEELRTVRRREVAEQLEYARSLGDLSENAEYQEAREMQGAVEERIGKLEGILKNANPAGARRRPPGGGGAPVGEKKPAPEKNLPHTMGAPEEADIMAGKV